MGTIKSVLDYYKNNAEQIALELSIGDELMNEVKAVGGELVINREKGTFDFINITDELKEKLNIRITKLKESNHDNQ